MQDLDRPGCRSDGTPDLPTGVGPIGADVPSQAWQTADSERAWPVRTNATQAASRLALLVCESDMADDVRLPVPRPPGLELCDASTQLVSDAQAPGMARQLVRQLCGDAGVHDSVCDMVVLLTS